MCKKQGFIQTSLCLPTTEVAMYKLKRRQEGVRKPGSTVLSSTQVKLLSLHSSIFLSYFLKLQNPCHYISQHVV